MKKIIVFPLSLIALLLFILVSIYWPEMFPSLAIRYSDNPDVLVRAVSQGIAADDIRQIELKGETLSGGKIDQIIERVSDDRYRWAALTILIHLYSSDEFRDLGRLHPFIDDPILDSARNVAMILRKSDDPRTAELLMNEVKRGFRYAVTIHQAETIYALDPEMFWENELVFSEFFDIHHLKENGNGASFEHGLP